MAITLPQMMRGRWMAALFAGTAMMAAGSLGTQTEQNFDGEVPTGNSFGISPILAIDV
jgi:hypothetical protein